MSQLRASTSSTRWQRYVRSVRSVPYAQISLSSPYYRLPDGESELLVTFGAGHASASFIGPRTQLLEKPTTKRTHALLVRFRAAGAYPFFGMPMSELTDQVVALADVWPREHVDALAAVQDAATATHCIWNALATRLAQPYEPACAPAVLRAVQLAVSAERIPSVSDLLAALDLSERQLRRGFADIVGLAPKRFLRAVRFRRALRAARSTSSRPDWAAIAESVGYFDQAHLSAEFRALSGMTPTALLATPFVRSAQDR